MEKYRKPRKDSMLAFCQEVVQHNKGALRAALLLLDEGNSDAAYMVIKEVIQSLERCNRTINTGEYDAII